MKRIFWKQLLTHSLFACILFVGSLWIVSCEDEYKYDNQEPDWLGASIYDYLKENGSFNYYVRLIDDLNLREVFAKTGSKTLFVASDSTFIRFFQDNTWGITSYEQLSLAQKRFLINYNTINNAYLIETLANYSTNNDEQSLVYGKSLRRVTGVTPIDSIPFEKGDQLPNGRFWNYYKTNGIYMVKDDSWVPMVYFLQRPLSLAGITDDDFKIMTGLERTGGDAYIFDCKVVKRDITCKNGYVHVLDKVLMPRTNMADYIQDNPQTSTFASILDRFCAPYYSEIVTTEYRKIHPEFTDSIFVKRFYSDKVYVSNPINKYLYPNATEINPVLILPFDPGWNSYYYNFRGTTTPLQADMAAMFVPTDDAMDYYFNEGKGKLLKERFGTWEAIPDNIIVLLLKRHMRESFIASVPSRFPKLMDSENQPVKINKNEIVGRYIGVNGMVYLTNNVYPPADYESVYAPVLFSPRTKIFNWAIVKEDFRLYLNSLESRFSFFVPTDQYLTNYVDPLTIGKSIPGALKYWYNERTFAVNATVYKYDAITNTIGDSVGVITNETFLRNRLLDLLDTHIVVGDVESGQKYYLTKGGQLIRVSGSGMGLTVEGGGDIDRGVKSNVIDIYPQANGNVYFIDKYIQTPMRSVYKVLSTTPEFEEFFKLLAGFPAESNSVIFVRKSGFFGIDFSIKFLNTYHYTVYVPTNQAILDAINSGMIKPWDTQGSITGINDIADPVLRNIEIQKLERFLRYHFQDNSVIISGNSVSGIYASATIKTDDSETRFNTFKNKYYKIGISGNGSTLDLITENNGTASVITNNGLYNIITRDHIFSDDPNKSKEIDGTGTGSVLYSTTTISTSSTAVIHQIDKVLQFQ